MSLNDDCLTCAPSTALAEAARVAGFAPSVHSTQPWRWSADSAMLELHADPTRQLTGADPGGRLMVLSCGAALHHARIALAAQGLSAVVERLAGLDRPRLLARLTVSGRPSLNPEAVRLLHAVQIRRADRWPMTDAIVDQSQIDRVRAAVEAEHSWLRILPHEDLLDLALAAGRTQGLAEFDPHETADRVGGLGEPDPAERAADDSGALHAILFGSADTPTAWLNAGEALSAGWLTATQLGLHILPMIAPVNGDNTRQVLRRRLPPLSEPFLVLRFAAVDAIRSARRKPRLTAGRVVDPPAVANGVGVGRTATHIESRPLAAVSPAREG